MGECCIAGTCLGSFQRRHLRQKLNIRGDGCTDCLAHSFCLCCALAQEDRELQLPVNREILAAEKPRNYIVRQQPGHRPEMDMAMSQPSSP